MEREIILVSACLLGAKVRYDGTKTKHNPQMDGLLKYFDIIPICPEMDGGLPCPRPASEIKDGKVINKLGKDVSSAFYKGASLATEVARRSNAKFAILKDNSPSCGSTHIYDGDFKARKIKGVGITTKALLEIGIKVYSETDIPAILKQFDSPSITD